MSGKKTRRKRNVTSAYCIAICATAGSILGMAHNIFVATARPKPHMRDARHQARPRNQHRN